MKYVLYHEGKYLFSLPADGVFTGFTATWVDRAKAYNFDSWARAEDARHRLNLDNTGAWILAENESLPRTQS